MRTRRMILISVICLLSLGAASGAAFTLRTIAMYSGACESLGGFPGLLQSAGFVPTGNCKLKGGECSTAACVVSGKKGHCVKVVTNKKAVCVCKPNRISK